jgi:hypothetical protein
MCEESETFIPARRLIVNRRLLTPARELGDGSGDRLVQAAIQDAEVVCVDRRVRGHREFGDGLTDVSIVMHHLRRSKSLTPHVGAVKDRVSGNRRSHSTERRQPIMLQGVDELIEKDGHP